MLIHWLHIPIGATKHLGDVEFAEFTDLVSTGVEEVPQTDDVAVVQLSHDLQLTVLESKRKTNFRAQSLLVCSKYYCTFILGKLS